MNQESAESLLSALRSELEAAAEIDRVFEMLDREGLERGHGRCVTKIVAGSIGGTRCCAHVAEGMAFGAEQ